MKITIEYDDDDETELSKVEFVGACGTTNEFAATLLTLVDTTNFDFSAVVSDMLSYTSGESPWLRKAISAWLEDNKDTTDSLDTSETEE